ncbi:MAG: glycosyltransferase family 4 protein [Prochlorococcaceae cyanobacterium]
MIHRPRILLLLPEAWGHDGGVQAYGRGLLQSLREARPGAVIEVISVLDRPDQRPAALLADPALQLQGLGGGPRWRWEPRLLRSALAAAGRRPGLVLAAHVHLAPAALLAARRAGAGVWLTAHGKEVWGLPPGLRRSSLRRVDRLLPVSRYTASQLQPLLQGRRSPPPCSVLSNAFDPGRFHPGPRPPVLLQRYGLGPQTPLLFSLTRLSVADRPKRIERLIEAMPELRRLHPELRLLIGGDGDNRPRLQELVGRLGLTGAVLLPGRLADEELADHFRLATVFALPSSKEGFGIVFLEALGCGCPVLGGNRDGTADPLQDGRLGALVDPDGPLVPHLDRLLRRQGPSLWFEPQALAAATAAAFGEAARTRALAALLDAHAPLLHHP